MNKQLIIATFKRMASDLWSVLRYSLAVILLGCAVLALTVLLSTFCDLLFGDYGIVASTALIYLAFWFAATYDKIKRKGVHD